MRSWDPIREMDARFRELERMMSTVPRGSGSVPASFLPGRAARAYPLINMAEDQDHVYIEALAPGIDPQKIELTAVRNTLTISGEKSGPSDVAAEAFHRSERAAGKFVRTIDLPVDVNSDGISAKYADGLLLITLPKAEEAKPRQIQVAVS